MESPRSSLLHAKKQIPLVTRSFFNKSYYYLGHYHKDLYYLHYLCMVGNAQKLEKFCITLINKYGCIKKILNDNSQYGFWYGTPLHTLMDWNNNIHLTNILIKYGSDINIQDYYERYPDDISGLFIIPFTFKGFVQKIASFRDPSDFKQVSDYLKRKRYAQWGRRLFTYYI